MHWMTDLITGLKSLLRKRQINRELDQELEGYLEASASHKQQSGMSEQAARRAARIEIGSRTAVKHQVWASRWESGLDNLFHDLRFALRQLVKTPGFTAVALLSLALGIGANTAIFTLLNAVLLRPLPVAQPQQLVLFGHGRAVGGSSGLPSDSTDLYSYRLYREFAARTPSFSGITAVSSIRMGSHISFNGNSPEPIFIDLVSGSYFDVLGLPPALGRDLAEPDDRAPGAGPVAVASYTWFQRNFAGNRAALGQSIRIQGHDYTLIGVAKPGFTGLNPSEPADLWIPLSMEKEISPGWNGIEDYDFQSLYLIGRLKPGVSIPEATASANLLFRQILRSEYLGANPSPKDLASLQHARIELTSIAGGLPGMRLRFSAPLAILMSISGLVLLIACANIANMLLARGVARTREVAVRQALGASRGRIVLQLLTESLLLSIAGAVIGILLASKASHLLLVMASSGPDPIPIDLTPDVRVLGFTLIVTVLTALLFGIAPALRATRLELIPALREGRGSPSSATRGNLARGLIVGQIALSILLLAASGLFLRSLLKLTSVDLGFNPHDVLVFSLDEYSANLPAPSKDDQRLTHLQQQIEQNVQSLPGVHSASFSMFTFNQGEWSDSLLMQGVPRTPENSEEVYYNVVGDQFLSTMEIPLLAGRNFNAQDTAAAPQVAIVNETLARRFFPSGSAIGHRFCLGDDPACSFDVEIVGVVRDARYVGIGERQHTAAYFPYTQRVQYFGNFSVRYSGSAEALVPAVRRAVAQANPAIVVAEVTPLSAQVLGSIVTQRLIAQLSVFFGILAVFLAAIGIYGLMNLTVVRRNNEIGIRLALGSQPAAVLWLVLRESLLLLSIGLATGLPLALSTTQLLRRQLFQLSPNDPLTFIAAALLLSVITLLAAWIPARRATQVDPMQALRCD